jgi:thioesterase domain-containing protein
MCSGGTGNDLILVHPANGLTEPYGELVGALGKTRRVVGISARATNSEACHPSDQARLRDM